MNGFCGCLGYGNKALCLVILLLVLPLESFEGQLPEVFNRHGHVSAYCYGYVSKVRFG